MKNLHQHKNYTKYFYSINKAFVEITAILNLHAQIQQVLSSIVYIPCLKMLYELQASIIGGGGGEMK